MRDGRAATTLLAMSTEEKNTESLMESTGLGLLPGVAVALGLMILAMALVLTGSMWAVAFVLLLIGACLGAILYVVVAVSSEGERGRRLRRRVPGL
jgi:O-antigen/teichoic acid export membrane protein